MVPRAEEPEVRAYLELHPDQPARDQGSQELAPERLGLVLPTSRPMISRRPVLCTAWAIKHAFPSDEAIVTAFSTFASTNTHG